MRILIAIVICSIVGVSVFYYEFIYSIILLPSIIFLRGVLLRRAVRKILLFLLLPLLPILIRRRWSYIQDKAKEWGKACYYWWRELHLILRVLVILPFLGLAGIIALTMGSVLGFLALLPIKIPVPSIVAYWLKRFILPYFAKIAAAKWLSFMTDSVWAILPENWNQYISKHYRSLWWWTMRRLVRSRMIFGKRSSIVAEKANDINELVEQKVQ